MSSMDKWSTELDPERKPWGNPFGVWPTRRLVIGGWFDFLRQNEGPGRSSSTEKPPSRHTRNHKNQHSQSTMSDATDEDSNYGTGTQRWKLGRLRMGSFRSKSKVDSEIGV